MTPESIPGRLVPTDLELLLHLANAEGIAHNGPPQDHHELFLTDLPEAA